MFMSCHLLRNAEVIACFLSNKVLFRNMCVMFLSVIESIKALKSNSENLCGKLKNKYIRKCLKLNLRVTNCRYKCLMGKII